MPEYVWNEMNGKSSAKNFEELKVYSVAREITRAVYELTRSTEFARDFNLVNQIRRASISMMANIAEGYERENNTEFVQFLYYAKGSCGELRAHLTIALDQRYIDEKKHAKVIGQCKKLSGMLKNLIGYLRNSDLTGTRHKRSSTERE